MDKTGFCLVVVLALVIFWDLIRKWIKVQEDKVQLKSRAELYNWEDRL